MQKSLTDVLNSKHVFNLFGMSKEQYEIINKINHEFELVTRIILDNIDGYTYINGDLTVDIEKIAELIFGDMRGKNCGQVNRMLEGYRRRLFRYVPKAYINEKENDRFGFFYYGFGIAKKTDYLHHVSGYPFVVMELDEYFKDALLLDTIITFYGVQVVGDIKYSEKLLCELFKKRLKQKIYLKKPNEATNIKWSDIPMNPNQIPISFDEGKEYLAYLIERGIIVGSFTTNDEEKTFSIEFT